MNRKTGIVIALLLALVILSAFVSAHLAGAAAETGICYVSSWDGSNLTVRWFGGPSGVNFFAIFTLHNLTTGETIVAATEDWTGNLGDTYMWLDYPFIPDSWQLTGLQVFADTSSGRQSQDCPGTWFLTITNYYLPRTIKQ